MGLKSKGPGYLELVGDGEPFRLLFPAGIIIGLVGVLLWPLNSWGFWQSYPAVIHARIMIEGFLTAFILGFLGTAFPRLIEVKRFGLKTAFLLLSGLFLLVGMHLGQRHLAGDLLFILLLGAFLLNLALRARSRRDIPPPAFILVGLGLLSGLLGALLQVAIQTIPYQLPSIAFPMARLLLYQGYILMPIMGVGAFFLPRFFGIASQQSFPESFNPPKGWARRAWFAAICGGMVLASFLLEASGWQKIGHLLRGLSMVLFVTMEWPVLRNKGKIGTFANSTRLALLSIPLGYGAMVLQPLHQTALLHVIFITGFSLLVLNVASRVLLGHSGQGHLFNNKSWAIRTVTGLIVLAMLTRVSADWLPQVRLSHYAYAGLAWAVGTLIWSLRLIPAVRQPDSEN